MTSIKTFPILTSEHFIRQYMAELPPGFSFRDRPIQIYPIHQVSHLIKFPTPLFRTQFNYLVFLTKGSGIQQVDNELLELQVNSMLFIREGHLHAIKAISPDAAGYFIYFDNSILPDLLSNKSKLRLFFLRPLIDLSDSEAGWIGQCAELLLSAAAEKNSGLEVEVPLLQAILNKLYLVSNVRYTPIDRQAEIAFQFKELVYQNYERQREVRFYAEKLSVTENYLNRCVKKTTGKSPKEYINEITIFQSQLLLQDLTKEVAQVAFELNFEDPSYFSRLFKKITSLTPGEFRASLKHDLSG